MSANINKTYTYDEVLEITKDLDDKSRTMLEGWTAEVKRLRGEQRSRVIIWKGVAVATFILGFVMSIVGYWMGAVGGLDQAERNAAKDGAGRYVADPVTGTVSFKWGRE